ncbi:MAG: hypothetical protein Q8P61_00690 [Candidatus Nanopelagicales bacterium]|nr:hypothetical protein [Candidatus Nanopelagicales bacterium]
MTETATRHDVERWQAIGRRAQVGSVIPLAILACGLTVVLLGCLWSWLVWRHTGGTPRISAFGFTLRSYGALAAAGIAGAGATIWWMDGRARRRTGAALTMVPVVATCMISASVLLTFSVLALSQPTYSWKVSEVVMLLEPALTAFAVGLVLTVWGFRSKSRAVRGAAIAVWVLLAAASAAAAIEVSVVTSILVFFYSTSWSITIVGMPVVLWSAMIVARREAVRE